MTVDYMTVLQCASNLRLAKRCHAPTPDGFAPCDMPKHFHVKALPVRGLGDVHKVVSSLQHKPRHCVIRGEPKAGKTGTVRRTSENFEDVPRHWLCIDVDGFRPTESDPAAAPIEASHEFIREVLPEFKGASFVCQQSSRAGVVPGVLKCHLWFWLDTPATSAELRRWAKATNAQHPGAIDEALYSPVQIHYTANPIFTRGTVDPIAQRVWLYQGMKDSVRLTVPEDTLRIPAWIAPRGAAKLAAVLNLDLMILPDAARIATALSFIEPDDYPTWIKVGQCLYALAPRLGEEVAHNLWLQYSARGSNVETDGPYAPEAKWATFSPQFPPDAAAGVLLGMARDAARDVATRDIRAGKLTDTGRAAAEYLARNHRAAFNWIKEQAWG